MSSFQIFNICLERSRAVDHQRGVLEECPDASLLVIFLSLIYEIKPHVTQVSHDTMILLLNSRKTSGKKKIYSAFRTLHPPLKTSKHLRTCFWKYTSSHGFPDLLGGFWVPIGSRLERVECTVSQSCISLRPGDNKMLQGVESSRISFIV